LNGQLGNLAHVVVTLFLTKTGETQSGLTTTSLDERKAISKR
jgi:hypothetical protein